MSQNGTIVFLFLLSIFGCTQNSEDKREIIELPITYQDGFGSFGWHYGLLHPLKPSNDPEGIPWNGMYADLRGIPKDWKSLVKSNVWLDCNQLLYQQYHLGNVDSAMYQSLKKSWEWVPDESRLSKKPIRSEVYVIRGLDKSGKTAIMVDTDNDLDFSDEIPFYPQKGIRDSARFYTPTHEIEYDIFRKGQVEARTLQMVIMHMPDEPSGQQYWYSFPHYAVATLSVKGKTHQLAINTGFSSPWAEFSEIILPEKSHPDQIFKRGQGTAKNAYFEVDGEKFKNLGVDIARNLLRLEGTANDDSAYVNEITYDFKQFTTDEFQTKGSISSNDYKGKYLFIDFWGTWCKPCVAALPELKAIYQKTNHEKVQFLSIAGNNSPEHLAKFLKKSPIPWPQILSDEQNKLVETFNITAYPSTMLIGPDGKIIAKNLHAKELEKMLKDYGCMRL